MCEYLFSPGKNKNLPSQRCAAYPCTKNQIRVGIHIQYLGNSDNSNEDSDISDDSNISNNFDENSDISDDFNIKITGKIGVIRIIGIIIGQIGIIDRGSQL